MMRALKIAATGMRAQQMNVDVLSNNIANINTTAFKRSRASFQDLMYQTQVIPGAQTAAQGNLSPTGLQIGLGVNVGSTYHLWEQGALSSTGGTYDIAIQGRGFLEITLPNGDVAYTRDGSLRPDNNGSLVTSDGYQVEPNIVIPEDATDVTISGDGIVTALVDNDTIELGQLQLVMFQNEGGLRNLGDNFYAETESSGAPVVVNPGEEGSGILRQYFLEASNVDPVEEVTTLITAQRSYELNSRVISSVDEMLNAVNQIR